MTEQNNWILCTPDAIKNGIGRLPSLEDCKTCVEYVSDKNEYYGRFIVTTVSGFELTDRTVTSAFFRISENENFWYRDNSRGDRSKMVNIVAWMPLPESYKGDGSEEDNDWILCTPDDIENKTGRLPLSDDSEIYIKYSSIDKGNECFSHFVVTNIVNPETSEKTTSLAFFRVDDNKNLWYTNHTEFGRFEIENVIAWKPLPEHYNGELIDFKFERAKILIGEHKGNFADILHDAFDTRFFALSLDSGQRIIMRSEYVEIVKETD